MKSGKAALSAKKIILYAVLLISAVALLLTVFLSPEFSEDERLDGVVFVAVTRLACGAVFACVLLLFGYNVVSPNFYGGLRSLLFVLPAFAVAINNFPFIAFFTGDAKIDVPAYYIAFTALECLAIGFFEEYAFRGVFLLSFLEKKKNRKDKKSILLILVVCSLCFGLLHLVNLFEGAGFAGVVRQVGYSSLIGAMCSVILLKTHNIHVCVLIHALFDFCGTLVPTFGSGKIWNTPTIVITVIISLAVTAFFIFVFVKLDVEELDGIFFTKDESDDKKEREH